MAARDDILIDPTPQRYVEAVRAAATAVSQYLGTWDATQVRPVDALAVWADVRARVDGWHDWEAHPGRRTRTGIARVVWWTDHVGRKHLRVHGLVPGATDEPLGPHRPPLLALYPEAVVGVQRFGRTHLIGVCDCGAWGEPGELGWMGPTCGPCFDREDGERFAPDHWRAASGPIERLAVAADGRVAVAADRAVTVWQTGPPRLVGSWAAGRQIDGLTFGPGGHLGWETPEGVRIRLPEGGSVDGPYTRLGFHPDGRGVFLFAPPDTLLLWDLPTHQRRGPLRVPYRLDVWNLAASPDGRLLAALMYDWLMIWNVYTGQPMERVPVTGPTGLLAWSPDGSALMYGEATGLRWWGSARGRTAAHARWGAYHPTGAWLVFADYAGLRVWKGHGTTEERAVEFHGAQAFGLSPDARTLAVGTYQGRVRLVPGGVLWDG